MTRVAPLILVSLALAGCAEPQRHEARGTFAGRALEIELWALGRDESRTLGAEVESALAGFMTRIDADDPASSLGALNAVAGTEPYRVEDRDVYRCVLLALDWARATRGAFDPTIGGVRRAWTGRDPSVDVPDAATLDAALAATGWADVIVMEEARALRFRRPAMRLDLETIGPGFALDVAARKFSMTGAIAGLLRYGGTTYAWGAPPGAEGWSAPLGSAAGVPIGTLELSPGRAVSRAARDETPAVGVLDPSSGRPPTGEIAVALALADSGGDAAAIAAGLLVAGVGRAGGIVERSRRVEAVLFVDGGEEPRILASATLRGRLRLTDEVQAAFPGGVRYILGPRPE